MRSFWKSLDRLSRIRCSHRRGPGSIPVVGIVSFFGKFHFIRREGLAIHLAFVNVWSLLDHGSPEHVHLVIFGDQILAQLHDYQFMEVSQWLSFDRLSNYQRVFYAPYVKKFRVKPPNNNMRNIIYSLHHDLPRGLVVWIRCSHRRGLGSIPGVGIASFFGKFRFIRRGGLAIRLGFVNM